MQNTCLNPKLDPIHRLQLKLKSTIACLKNRESPVLVDHILHDVAGLVTVSGERYLREQHQNILGLLEGQVGSGASPISSDSPISVASSTRASSLLVSASNADLVHELLILNRALRASEAEIQRLKGHFSRYEDSCRCGESKTLPSSGRPGSCKSRKHRREEFYS